MHVRKTFAPSKKASTRCILREKTSSCGTSEQVMSHLYRFCRPFTRTPSPVVTLRHSAKLDMGASVLPTPLPFVRGRGTTRTREETW